MAQSPCLGAKPTTGLDVIGQNYLLELRTRIILKQGLQLGRRIDRGHDMLLRCATTVRLRLQSEPVMGMRTERDDVAGFFDWAKQIAAKNFHGHTAGKARKIQLRRLRKPRKIRRHYDGLVFVTPEKREYFCVIWKEKFEGTA